MRQLVLAAISAFGLLFTAQAKCASYGTQYDSVVKLFQSNSEPTAKDAVWTAKHIFKVGVISNGTQRNGYASYVCEILYDHGFKGQKVWVQVIDIVQLSQNGKWIKLGEARCL
jgi:hypothetical protein